MPPGAVVEGEQPLVAQAVDGNEAEPGEMELLDVDRVGVDRRFGGDIQATPARPRNRHSSRHGLEALLELEDGRPERHLGIAGRRRGGGGPPAEVGQSASAARYRGRSRPLCSRVNRSISSRSIPSGKSHSHVRAMALRATWPSTLVLGWAARSSRRRAW